MQKSRIQWITQGDRNTRFFHLFTIIRRRRNKIDRLKIENVWSDNQNLLADHTMSSFNNLFDMHECEGIDWNHSPIGGRLSSVENSRLDYPISEWEIKNAIFNMKPLKVPGPDGIQPIFYHNYWDKVGPVVCKFMKKCFIEGSFPQNLNSCFITLIPKVENPETITQFRPITLCNVSYKILTKVLVNRIRSLLGNLIGPFQSSFLPGRQTSDNIIITQEIIHSLEKRKGKDGGMIEKAYDKISWDFLEKALYNINLNSRWIKLITSCVKGGNTAVLWNGEPLPSLNQKRGLRQGDPLSPYFFVICMEYLSGPILKKVETGEWLGIKASPNGPAISHLFFADDLMLFAKADSGSCATIMEVLNEFCCKSG